VEATTLSPSKRILTHKEKLQMTTTNAPVTYKPRNIQVEIIEAFAGAQGRTLVVIKALHGKPFADGAKTTTKTAYRTVSLDDLEVCTCTPRDEIACPACQHAARERYGDEIPF
jgi:hypothetical protein